jgi:hypothetical protein
MKLILVLFYFVKFSFAYQEDGEDYNYEEEDLYKLEK